MISFINDTEYVSQTKKVIVKMVDLPPGDWDSLRNIGTETMEKNMEKNMEKTPLKKHIFKPWRPMGLARTLTIYPSVDWPNKGEDFTKMIEYN